MSNVPALQSVMADQIVELKAENARLRAESRLTGERLDALIDEIDPVEYHYEFAGTQFANGRVAMRLLRDALLADSPEVGET